MPKIYFIAAYLGMLKYYEKLLPYLRGKYETCFLFVGENARGAWSQMGEHCEKNNYRFYIIKQERGRQGFLDLLPFVGVIRKSRAYTRECVKFLDKEKPAKIVTAHNLTFRTMALFREANRRGVDTLVLQWALVSGRAVLEAVGETKRKEKESFLRKTYYKLTELLLAALNIFHPKGSLRGTEQEALRIGVTDNKARESFIELGYDPSRIQVVGHIDSELAYELRKRIVNDQNFRHELEKKYGLEYRGLNPEKLQATSYKLQANIIVISTCFHHKDIRVMNESEQVEYYYRVFEDIRHVFSPEEAEILFKLHPSEPQIYDRCLELGGLRLYTEDARTEELVALSDLYIAHPMTTVNNIARAAGMPAIFINFSGLKFIDEAGKFFEIKNTAHARAEFIDLLKNFKHGVLELQYEESDLEVHSIEKILRLIG